MRQLLIIVLVLVSTVAWAQDGIVFYQGTWKETLAKAKAENKLIFLDIYTSWCGPCKIMAKDIFPLKTVGDKFNAHFINYKVDAEKGEGIAIARTYKVAAYPTYLFVNGDGILYYTSLLGSMPVAAFLKEADIALAEFADPKPLPMWEAEYTSRKNDKDFLIRYVQKRQKRRIKSEAIVEQYVSLAAKDEMLSKETLHILFQEPSAAVDGAFYTFLAQNKAEVVKSLDRTDGYLEYMLRNYAWGDLIRAVAKRDVSLMEKIAAILESCTSETPASWEGHAVRMGYYTQTGNEKALMAVLNRYGNDVANYDKEKISEANAKQVASFEKGLESGRFKEASPEQLEQLRKYYCTLASANYANRLRAIAEAAFKCVNDKKILNGALNWLDLAASYSDHFAIAETRAGILHKLGKKEEAITYQQKAIAGFATLKIESPVISKRLQDNLSKIRANEATWVQSNGSTVVSEPDHDMKHKQ